MDDPGWIVRGNGDGGVGHSRCTGSAGGSDAMAGGRIERPRLSGGRRRPADGHLWGTRARHPRLEGLAARYALLNADLYTRRTIEGSSPVVKPIEAVGIGREPRGRGETVSRGRLRGRTERHDTAGAWRRRCRFCRYPTRCRRGIRRCGYRLTIGYAPMRRSLARAGWRTVNSWDKGSPPSLRWNMGRGHRFKPSSAGHRPTVHEDNHQRPRCTTPSLPPAAALAILPP